MATLGVAGLAEAQVVRQLTHTEQRYYGATAMERAGTSAYAVSTTNQFGDNPRHAPQVVRFDLLTEGGETLTRFPEGVLGALSVADGGEPIVFSARINPFCTNADRSSELFLMNADGSGLVQLTSLPSPAIDVIAAQVSGSGNRVLFATHVAFTPSDWFVVDADGSNPVPLPDGASGAWISDDGERVVFRMSGAIQAMHADASGLRVVSPFGSGAQISGDGAVIVFRGNADPLGTNPDGSHELFAVGWDGAGLRQLTDDATHGSADSYQIADDGRVYFLDGTDDLWRVGTEPGAVPELLAEYSFAAYPNVSGDGTAVITSQSQAGLTVWSETAPPRSLVTNTSFAVRQPDLAADASAAVFLSSADPFGTNPDRSTEVFHVLWDGSQLTQVTDLEEVELPALGGDFVVFTSTTNATGQNAAGSRELFRIDVDGEHLRQLTTAGDSAIGAVDPDVSADGSTIVFASSSDLVGQNADHSQEIFCMTSDGQNVRQVTSALPDDRAAGPRVDAAGTWIVFHSTANLTGSNPTHLDQVYRARCDGTGLEQLSASSTKSAQNADISADGNRVVFDSTANPLGLNADAGEEVFLRQVEPPSVVQLTRHATSRSKLARISGDGTDVYFQAFPPYFDPPGTLRTDLMHVVVDGGVVERASGLPAGEVASAGGSFLVPPVAVDHSGERAVFVGIGDFAGENPDATSEMWLVDRTATPTIELSGRAPTVVSWSHDPRAVTYDVIRGDLGAAGPAGLGPVVCLENDSGNARTDGCVDDEDPPTGEAFFYLVRGSQGMLDGPGSYGVDSAGNPRVVGVGDCAP